MAEIEAVIRAALAWIAIGAAACVAPEDFEVELSEAEWQVIRTLSPLPEPPLDPTNLYAGDPAAEELGRALFFERSHAGPIVTPDDGDNGGLGLASEPGRVSCADCHMPERWFHDERSRPNQTTLALDWTPRNTPSIVDAVFYDWFSWSGAAETLWQESIGATFKPAFQGSSRLAVAHMLYDRYRRPYEQIFGPMDPRLDPAHPEAVAFPPAGSPGDPAYDSMAPADQAIVNTMVANYGKAIAAYCRLLVSGASPFDRFVAGDDEAIGVAAKRGLRLFIGKAGCIDCHSGPLLSDNEFHNLGVPQRGEHVPERDSGRYDAVIGLLASEFSPRGLYSDAPSGHELDGLAAVDAMRGQFRTKGLRHVAETGPYMHTGGFATLEEVVRFYNDGGGDYGFEGQRDELIGPLGLSEDEIADLVAFLRTLTGEPVAETLLPER